VDAYVVQPIKRTGIISYAKKQAARKEAVTLHRTDAGFSYNFTRLSDLGVVLRVDDQQVVHLTGMMVDSPLQGKCKVGWHLMTINGKRVKARREAEVQELLKNASFPLRLTFNAPIKSKLQEEREASSSLENINFDDERKLIFIMLGVYGSFTNVSSISFDWPDFFTQLKGYAKYFAFNLNFFAPECAAETPYTTTWLSYLSVPYAAQLPILICFAMAYRWTVPGSSEPAKQVKCTLLVSAAARLSSTLIIGLMNFHIGQLVIPFACAEIGGINVMVDRPEIYCSYTEVSDSQYIGEYSSMTRWGMGCASAFCCSISFIVFCMWKSYHWQVNVFGQRGYVGDVRRMTMENVMAVKTYDLDAEQLEQRVLLTKAKEKLRGRTGNKEEKLTQDQQLKRRVNIMKAKTRMKKRHIPDFLEGTFLTYSWIFLVNQLLRSLVSTMVIKLLAGAPTVAGGAVAQMCIIMVNLLLLLCYQPYASKVVNFSETFLLGLLFVLLLAAVLHNLISNHKDADLYQTYITQFSYIVNGIGVIVFIAAPSIPAYLAFRGFQKVAAAASGPDSIFNKLYFASRLQEVKSKSANKSVTLKIETTAEELLALASIKDVLPAFDRTQMRLRDAGLGSALSVDDQQRRLHRLAKLATKVQDERAAARNLLTANEQAEELRKRAEQKLREAEEDMRHLEEEEEAERIAYLHKEASRLSLAAANAEQRAMSFRQTRHSRKTKLSAKLDKLFPDDDDFFPDDEVPNEAVEESEEPGVAVEEVSSPEKGEAPQFPDELSEEQNAVLPELASEAEQADQSSPAALEPDIPRPVGRPSATEATVEAAGSPTTASDAEQAADEAVE